MATHYFLPSIEFVGLEAATVTGAIDRWEAGELEGTRGVRTRHGRPLPRFVKVPPNTTAHRTGLLAAGDGQSYRLRFEWTLRPSDRVRVGLWFSGPGAPTDETRGGGELLRELLRVGRARYRHEALPARVRRAEERLEVGEVYEHVVSEGRRIPILLVSCRASGEQLVDSQELLTFVGGMAHVWWLKTPEATFAFRAAFIDRGLDKRWACYDGGVRLYLPGFEPARQGLADHPLLLAHRLLSSGRDPAHATAEWALPRLARALGEHDWMAIRREQLPPRVAPVTATPMAASLGDLTGGALERIRQAVTEHGEQPQPLAPHVEEPAPPPEPTVEMPVVAPPAPEGAADAPEDEPALVQRPPDPAPPPAPAAEADEARPAPPPPAGPLQAAQEILRTSLDSLAAIEEHLNELEEDRSMLEAERDELLVVVERLEQEDQQANLLPSSVYDVAALAGEMFGTGLEITRHALHKAAKSHYRDGALAAQVLVCIAAGGGEFGLVRDLLARLGNRVAASSSESRHTMKAFGDERRFPTDDGSIVECQQHVTLGHGQRNPHTTLHIYFDRVGDRARILYIGPHLRTVSGNT